MTTSRSFQKYTVQPGDTLQSIAVRFYGNAAQWEKIWKSNTLRSGNPDRLIVGEELTIPVEREIVEARARARSNRYKDRGKDSVVLIIGNKEVLSTQGRFACGFNQISRAWNASIPWTPGKDPEFDRLTARGSFADSQLYLGGELVGTGRLYAREATLSASGVTKTLEFYSKSADIVDSSLNPKFSQISNSNLQQIADAVCDAMDFNAYFPDGPGAVFTDVQRKGDETIGKYFQRLAANRGLFVSDDPYGDLVFQKMKAGPHVADFIAGKTWNAGEYKIKFDDRGRFRDYFAYTSTGMGEGITADTHDYAVPTIRQILFEMPDADKESIVDAANWMMIKGILQAYSFTLPVFSWYGDDKSTLWKPMQTVSVQAPVLDIPEKKEFLILSIEFQWSASGASASLRLIPPLEIDNSSGQPTLAGNW